MYLPRRERRRGLAERRRDEVAHARARLLLRAATRRHRIKISMRVSRPLVGDALLVFFTTPLRVPPPHDISIRGLVKPRRYQLPFSARCAACRAMSPRRALPPERDVLAVFRPTLRRAPPLRRIFARSPQERSRPPAPRHYSPPILPSPVRSGASRAAYLANVSPIGLLDDGAAMLLLTGRHFRLRFASFLERRLAAF